MNTKEKIVKKYHAKIIGERYNAQKLYAHDILSEDSLISLLYDLFEHQVDINENGINFLQEYWGLENVANIIWEYEEWDGDFHKNFKSIEEIVGWLKNFEKGKLNRALTVEEKTKHEIQQAFFKKYGGKKLGGTIDDDDIQYYANTLMDEDKALDFLVHLSKNITYLTLTGYDFFNKVYGFKCLAKKLYEKYPGYVKKDSEKNLKWLLDEKHSFIK